MTEEVVITKRFRDLAERLERLMTESLVASEKRREAEIRVARCRAWLAEAEAELAAAKEAEQQNRDLSEPVGDFFIKLLEIEGANLPAAAGVAADTEETG